MKPLLLALMVPVGAGAALATVLGEAEGLTQIGAAGALVMVLLWLGKLLKAFFTEHLAFVKRMAQDSSRNSRNMERIVEELRRRPCIADHALAEVMAEPDDAAPPPPGGTR